MAIGLTWGVLGLVVAWGTWGIRGQVRSQIVARDGQVLLAMARSQAGIGGVEGAGEGEGDLAAELREDPWAVFMHIGGREGIVAGWLFNEDGEVQTTLPASVRDTAIPADARASLASGQSFARFLPAVPMAAVFLDPEIFGRRGWEGAVFPVVEVYVPLRGASDGSEGGVAGFLIDGRGVAREFRRLDRQLLLQGAGVQGFAMAITGMTLGMAFRRLNRAHRLLEARTEDLQRANRELSRSARIAALGAVTAHLIHGLRSPVTGLQSFVASRADGGADGAADWEEARAATQRMQALIQDVVRVIRDPEVEAGYEVPWEEIGGLVLERARPMADRRGVGLVFEGGSGRLMDGRGAGLLSLMLGNLVENAVEASPRGGVVTLRMVEAGEVMGVEVVDQGCGIRPEARARLFQPQPSSKEGGSGLGLAITRQMALALGGEVRLVRTDEGGTQFRVELPLAAGSGGRDGVMPAGAAGPGVGEDLG